MKEHMKQDTIDALIKDGFAILDYSKDDSVTNLSRTARIHSPPDGKTGVRPDIFITVSDEICSIAIHAHNGEAWCIAELNDIPHETLIRRLDVYEQKVVYAWRELRD